MLLSRRSCTPVCCLRCNASKLIKLSSDVPAGNATAMYLASVSFHAATALPAYCRGHSWWHRIECNAAACNSQLAVEMNTWHWSIYAQRVEIWMNIFLCLQGASSSSSFDQPAVASFVDDLTQFDRRMNTVVVEAKILQGISQRQLATTGRTPLRSHTTFSVCKG